MKPKNVVVNRWWKYALLLVRAMAWEWDLGWQQMLLKVLLPADGGPTRHWLPAAECHLSGTSWLPSDVGNHS